VVARYHRKVLLRAMVATLAVASLLSLSVRRSVRSKLAAYSAVASQFASFSSMRGTKVSGRTLAPVVSKSIWRT